MARHDWSLLCDKTCIDQETKQVSLFGIVDVLNIESEAPPISTAKELVSVGPVRISFVTQFSRSSLQEPETAFARFILKLSNGKKINQPERTIDLTNSSRARIILRIDQLPYTGPGEYCFLVQLRSGDSSAWKKVAEVPLEVRLRNADME